MELLLRVASAPLALALLVSWPSHADPEEAVQQQGEVIRELREELSRVKEQQRKSMARVRALEDRVAAESASGGVDRDCVDRRIEDFERAPDARLFMSGYGSVTYRDAENTPST